MKFTIPGTLPGLNEYTKANRSNKYQAAKMKRQCEHAIGWAIKSKCRGLKLEKPIYIKFTWVEKNKRRDKDNICFAKKFIIDSMVQVGLIEDDGWKQIEGFEDSFKVDNKNPRVEVEIQEIN